MPLTRNLEFFDGAVPGAERLSVALAGDWVGDELDDIAVFDYVQMRLTVLRNDGDDLWAAQAGPHQFTNMPMDVVQTDLDCDGNPDFVGAGLGVGLEWAEWDGQTFASNDTTAAGPSTWSIAVGDLLFDPDGYPDIVLSQGAQSDRVQLFRNEMGSPTMEAELTMAAGDSPWDTLVVGTDAGLRIVVANANDTDLVDEGPADNVVNVVRVVDGPPTELILDNVLSPIETNFSNPFALASADFDGDGALEVAVAEKRVTTEDPQEGSDMMGSVRVFELDGSSWVESMSMPVGIGPTGMAVADMDCDGLPDLVVAGDGDFNTPAADGSVHVAWGAAQFGSAVTEVPALDLQGGGRLGVGDFDGNGAPEVVVTDWGPLMGTPPGRYVIVRPSG
jgi:hypothetical protein